MKKKILALTLALSAVLALSACGKDPAANAGPVKIATKATTEQYILGEMLGLIIEDAGYEVEITKGIGGIANAVGFGLRDKKHLGIHTEVLTESIVDLIEAGVVDNSRKKVFPQLVSSWARSGSMNLLTRIQTSCSAALGSLSIPPTLPQMTI